MQVGVAGSGAEHALAKDFRTHDILHLKNRSSIRISDPGVFL